MRTLIAGIVFSLIASSSAAQWLQLPTPGIPRTPDGKPNLTAPAPRTRDGKPDLSGMWERESDHYYNNAGADLKPADVKPWAQALYQRRLADFGTDSMEAQCLPLGPAALTTSDPVKFIQTPSLIVILLEDLTYRQIHMDGRKLPKNPNPSWMGYSVGRWDGDTLVVETSGFTERAWLDYDGHPHTEALRMTERYCRRDFGHLDVEVTFDDPGVNRSGRALLSVAVCLVHAQFPSPRSAAMNAIIDATLRARAPRGALSVASTRSIGGFPGRFSTSGSEVWDEENISISFGSAA